VCGGLTRLTRTAYGVYHTPDTALKPAIFSEKSA
jgi:hypothetical protein